MKRDWWKRGCKVRMGRENGKNETCQENGIENGKMGEETMGWERMGNGHGRKERGRNETVRRMGQDMGEWLEIDCGEREWEERMGGRRVGRMELSGKWDRKWENG